MSEIQLKHIQFGYKNSALLFDEINVLVNAKTFVFVLGENGSGKSTLLKLVLGALSPAKGDIFYDNKAVNSSKKRASFIGYIPQTQGIDPEMYVNDILDFVGSLHLLTGETLTKRKLELVGELGLESILNKLIKKLSGGQKQLVNIVVGLLHDPSIVLLDEPFVGLDYGTKSKLLAYFRASKKTVLCITHDLNIAESNADKVLVLKNGKIKEYDSPKTIVKNDPYYIAEIDYKYNTTIKHMLSENILTTKNHNRYTLICRNKEQEVLQIKQLLEEESEKLNGVKIFQDNLKSTLIGRYQFSFSDNKPEKKKRKK